MYKAAIQAGGRIDAMFFCPHANSDDAIAENPPRACSGIAERFGLGLAGVPAIGDSLRDVLAAAARPAVPVLY